MTSIAKFAGRGFLLWQLCLEYVIWFPSFTFSLQCRLPVDASSLRDVQPGIAASNEVASNWWLIIWNFRSVLCSLEPTLSFVLVLKGLHYMTCAFLACFVWNLLRILLYSLPCNGCSWEQVVGFCWIVRAEINSICTVICHIYVAYFAVLPHSTIWSMSLR